MTWPKSRKKFPKRPWPKKNTDRATGRGIYFDTSIELLMEKELIKRSIPYQKQAYIGGFVVDFYLPANKMIIECDGDYWHSLPNVHRKDIKKNIKWQGQGYIVHRFWEHEIKRSTQYCLDKIFKPYVTVI